LKVRSEPPLRCSPCSRRVAGHDATNNRLRPGHDGRQHGRAQSTMGLVDPHQSRAPRRQAVANLSSWPQFRRPYKGRWPTDAALHPAQLCQPSRSIRTYCYAAKPLAPAQLTRRRPAQRERVLCVSSASRIGIPGLAAKRRRRWHAGGGLCVTENVPPRRIPSGGVEQIVSHQVCTHAAA